MKKLLALILTLATLLVLVACGEAPITPTEAEATAEPDECALYGHEYQKHVVDPTYLEQGYTEYVCIICGKTYRDSYTPALDYISGVETLDKYVTYSEMQADVDAKRDKQYSDSNAKEVDISEFLPEYSGDPLLTPDEIKMLTTESDTVTTVTYDEAVYDIDVCFRMLKYEYGAYYYFGGDELFDAAKENCLTAIAGKETITNGGLADIIADNLSFIRDGHLVVNKKRNTDNAKVKYEYFYCKGQNYALDDGGYYKIIDGEKWYYVGCDNDAVSMQYAIDDEGRIVYSPVRFCPKYDENGVRLPDADDILLKKGDITKKQTVKWIENEAYKSHSIDFKYYKENGIAYISLRSFWFDYEETVNEFIDTAMDVKDTNVIILDIRSNSGGNLTWSYEWNNKFAGDHSNYRAFGEIKTTPQGKRNIDIKYDEIKRIANDIPIILLTDDVCMSAGEFFWYNVTSLENVTVIGSNTYGGMVCVYIVDRYLPNSKIFVSFGNALSYYRDDENHDAIGYEPDIWCNSKDALDVALRFIETNELADEEDVAAMYKHFPTLNSSGSSN